MVSIVNARIMLIIAQIVQPNSLEHLYVYDPIREKTKQCLKTNVASFLIVFDEYLLKGR